jgi:hypothetical protein
MAERYLMDTSAVIKYLNLTFPADSIDFLNIILEKESVISFISEIELQAWDPGDPDDMKVYHSFISKSTVIGIQEGLIKETIRIRKTDKLKLPDALIAASGIINDRILVADNDKDFLIIPELKYINPQRLAPQYIKK